MKDRLLQFLSAENISQAQFADSIGVARASISHIIAGRNKPGFDFIENTMKRYPALNIEWLINGTGKMYKANQDETKPGLLFSENPVLPVQSDNNTEILKSQRTIKKIIVYYSDNTFEEIV